MTWLELEKALRRCGWMINRSEVGDVTLTSPTGLMVVAAGQTDAELRATLHRLRAWIPGPGRPEAAMTPPRILLGKSGPGLDRLPVRCAGCLCWAWLTPRKAAVLDRRRETSIVFCGRCWWRLLMWAVKNVLVIWRR